MREGFKSVEPGNAKCDQEEIDGKGRPPWPKIIFPAIKQPQQCNNQTKNLPSIALFEDPRVTGETVLLRLSSALEDPRNVLVVPVPHVVILEEEHHRGGGIRRAG